jgi:hypothetical protein
MTRIEWIRSLSVEDIARSVMFSPDISREFCKGCDNEDPTDEQCYKCCLKWLKEDINENSL